MKGGAFFCAGKYYYFSREVLLFFREKSTILYDNCCVYL